MTNWEYGYMFHGKRKYLYRYNSETCEGYSYKDDDWTIKNCPLHSAVRSGDENGREGLDENQAQAIIAEIKASDYIER